MAIAVKLDDLLHDRRMTLTELAERVGITIVNLSILKTGKARAIRFSTLEAICDGSVVPARRHTGIPARHGRGRRARRERGRRGGGMNILMWIHIAGGCLAILSGAVAVAARKGGPLHARAGTWFFASMLVLGVTAAMLEPFRSPPGSPIGGILVCYFVATSWVAARRRDGTTGRFEILACAAALGMAALMAWGGVHGNRDHARGPRPGVRLRAGYACSPACSTSMRSCARSSRPRSASRVICGGCASPSSSRPAPSSLASRTSCPRRSAARRSCSSWPSRRSRSWPSGWCGCGSRKRFRGALRGAPVPAA